MTKIRFQGPGVGFLDTRYLNLSGSNADQNIDIGSYEFSADILHATSGTTGQSTIGAGLIVNNDSGSDAINDFQVNSDTLTAIFVDASADTLAIGVNTTFSDGKYLAIDQIQARDGDGLKLYDDGGNGIFVKDGGNVGIGTTGPGYQLEVAKSGASAISSIFNASDTDANRPILLFKRALGTLSNPTIVGESTWLGSFQANGYTGSGYYVGAGIDFYTDGATVSNRPRGSIRFSVGDDSGNYSEMVRMCR